MTEKKDRMRGWRIAAVVIGALAALAAFAGGQGYFWAIVNALIWFWLVWIIGWVVTRFRR